jgi:type VI secretion system protein ImpB
MADQNTQQWLGRNRPPRVQITYDLETRGAIEKKELPLVVGIIADLGGPNNPNPIDASALKTQKFIEIDRDNFDEVMKAIQPTLNINGQLVVFETIDCFTPDSLVKSVPELCKTLDIRQRLSELLVAVDNSEHLANDLFTQVQKLNAPPPPPPPPQK